MNTVMLQMRRSPTRFIPVIFVLALAALPLVATGSFVLSRYILAIAYLTTAVGLNLAMGYAGEFVLGHSVIMAAGAYIAGILSAKFNWPLALTLPCGIAAGTLLGLVIMSPGLRVRGWYYSLLTMFAVLVLPPTVFLLEKWTGGEYGLTGIHAATLFDIRLPSWALFEFALVLFALTWWLADNFVHSGWGHRLRALRDVRYAAEASGINLTQTRLVVYLLSAVPAAASGVILAYSTRLVGVGSFGISLMLLLLAGIVLGGPGTRWGPILGTGVLVLISFWVGPFSQYNAIFLGVGLLVGTLLFPDGVMPAVTRALHDRVLNAAARHPVVAEELVERPAEGDQFARSGVQYQVSEPIVVAKGIAKHFGGNLALAGVNVTIARGGLVGLVGPNGSGKSTFLNVLSGFLRPDEGAVTIDGIDTSELPIHLIAQAGVTRTFQVPQLIEEFNALENIEVGLVASEPRAVLSSLVQSPKVRKRGRERRDMALAAFHLVGLPESALSVPASELPLGLKRIVEVARAIVSKPKLLLLDEPAAGLNDTERTQLGHLLRRLKGFGISILIVEHNVPFLLEFCDELILLEMGAVTCDAKLGGALPERLLAYLDYQVEPLPAEQV